MKNESAVGARLALCLHWSCERGGAILAGMNLLANMRLIPNQVTAVRLAATLVMWILVGAGSRDNLGIGLVVCLASDVLDGQLARRLHQASRFGASFDSLADNLLIPSTLLWLWIVRREVYLENGTVLGVAILVYCLSLLLGKVGRPSISVAQLYLSKLSGLAMYLFAIHTFLAGAYSQALLYATLGLFFVSSLEWLSLQLLKSRLEGQMTTALYYWPAFRHFCANLPHRRLASRLFCLVYGSN